MSIRLELLTHRKDFIKGQLGLARSEEPNVIGLRPATREEDALAKAKSLPEGRVEIYGQASPVDTLDRNTLVSALSREGSPLSIKYYKPLDIWVDVRSVQAA